MTWTPDSRTRKHFGDLSVVSETNSGRETSHVIEVGDKRLRVLPHDAHSGQKRAVLVQDTTRRASTALVDGSEALVETYLTDTLTDLGLRWEWAEPDLIAWLHDWFWIWGQNPAEVLVADLCKAGWEVVWRGGTGKRKRRR